MSSSPPLAPVAFASVSSSPFDPSRSLDDELYVADVTSLIASLDDPTTSSTSRTTSVAGGEAATTSSTSRTTSTDHTSNNRGAGGKQLQRLNKQLLDHLIKIVEDLQGTMDEVGKKFEQYDQRMLTLETRLTAIVENSQGQLISEFSKLQGQLISEFSKLHTLRQEFATLRLEVNASRLATANRSEVNALRSDVEGMKNDIIFKRPRR